MGGASRTVSSGRRCRARVAAFAAAWSASSPAARSAVSSRGSAGAALARSTTSSSTTTPRRVAFACSKVQSFMGPPLPGQAFAEAVQQLLADVALAVHVLGRRMEGRVGLEAKDDASLAARAFLDERTDCFGHGLARHHARDA